MSLQIRPLTKHVGVEVIGVDLRDELDPEQIAQIEAAWQKWGVVIFRDQTFSRDDQTRFANAFGGLHVIKLPETGEEIRYINIANVVVDGEKAHLGNGEFLFHQDGVYAPNPARRTLLFSQEIPSVGGNTCFASTKAGYESLPAELRERLLQLDVHNSYEFDWVQRGVLSENARRYTHAIVVAYPDTNEPLLMINELMADHIVGLEPAESTALIQQLTGAIAQTDHIYEHVWRVGDFVAWDNWLVQHARTDFDPKERRVMRRCQTRGAPIVPYRDVIAARV